MAGNTKLVDHGIQNDESDYRAHICLQVGRAYLFLTEDANEAAQSGQYRTANATQPGASFVTGVGYLIPPTRLALPSLAEIEIPDDVLGSALSQLERLSGPRLTEAKGKIAEWVFEEMRKRGLFASYVDTILISDPELQMRGIDTRQPTFQIKCDYIGGPRYLGGSGSLFIQIQECNPFGIGRTDSLIA